MGVIGPTATLSAWASEYGRRLRGHLPPGRYFAAIVGSPADDLLATIGTEFARVRANAEAAFVALHPGQSTGAALDAWEDALGLPECGEASTETARRQQAAWAKFRATGGQSRAYFIELVADRFDLDASITEFVQADCNGDCEQTVYGAAWANTWALVLPMTDLYVAGCNDDCNDPLREWGRDELECLVSSLAPSHTRVLFYYEEAP